MRIIILFALILSLLVPSLCLAQDPPFKEAYALLYQGKEQAAIDLMKGYAETDPSPEVYYFIGYAYYEMEEFKKSAEYFNQAFVRKPFYSPMEKDEDE